MTCPGTLLGLPARADERLEQLSADVDERVAALDEVLATGQVAVDITDGDLHVRRLPGIERPEPTSALAAEIARRLPEVDLADVVIDVDAWTHFSEELSHAHGATPRQPRLREHRYAALLAHACNLGYARMGQAARIDPSSSHGRRSGTCAPRLSPPPTPGSSTPTTRCRSPSTSAAGGSQAQTAHAVPSASTPPRRAR